MSKQDAKAAARAGLYGSVEVLSETKSRAESRVKLLRSTAEAGEILASKLRPLQVMYADARAQVNAGLDRLLVEIETAGPPKAPEAYRLAADRAAREVVAFLQESDALLLGDDRTGVVEAALGLVEPISSALLDLWKTLRGEKKEKRDALIKRVEGLKWSAFDDVK